MKETASANALSIMNSSEHFVVKASSGAGNNNVAHEENCPKISCQTVIKSQEKTEGWYQPTLVVSIQYSNND